MSYAGSYLLQSLEKRNGYDTIALGDSTVITNSMDIKNRHKKMQ